MTVLDDKIIPKAFEIIEKYGKEFTFIDTTRTANPDTGNTTDVTTNRKHKVSPPDEYELTQTDGAAIRRGDTKVVLPAKGLTWIPRRNMRVKYDTVEGGATVTTEWTIVDSSPMYSGDLIAAYELQLRK